MDESDLGFDGEWVMLLALRTPIWLEGDEKQLVVVDEDKLKALKHRVVTSPDDFTAVFRRYDTKLKNSYFDDHLEKLIHYRGRTFPAFWWDTTWLLMHRLGNAPILKTATVKDILNLR